MHHSPTRTWIQPATSPQFHGVIQGAIRCGRQPVYWRRTRMPRCARCHPVRRRPRLHHGRHHPTSQILAHLEASQRVRSPRRCSASICMATAWLTSHRPQSRRHLTATTPEIHPLLLIRHCSLAQRPSPSRPFHPHHPRCEIHLPRQMFPFHQFKRRSILPITLEIILGLHHRL